jgi:chemotaxis protein MotB
VPAITINKEKYSQTLGLNKLLIMKKILLLGVTVVMSLSSCVSKKKFKALQEQLNVVQQDATACLNASTQLKLENKNKTDLIEDLRSQLTDCKNLRDKQLTNVGELTVLSKEANNNMKETLAQLEKKDKYIHYLQAAKSKADSLNLALAFNLKGVLKDGLDDQDVDVKVDKTVVFVNLSDKVLFKKGSFELSSKASAVLANIAKIIDSRPDLEVMVEGYTDNDPIKNSCTKDNWDLSVHRSTSVVRLLQSEFKINPNRLIAAGRGEFNELVPNTTPENKAINRRTRIIILPKLNQFYELLDPKNAPQ